MSIAQATDFSTYTIAGVAPGVNQSYAMIAGRYSTVIAQNTPPSTSNQRLALKDDQARVQVCYSATHPQTCFAIHYMAQEFMTSALCSHSSKLSACAAAETAVYVAKNYRRNMKLGWLDVISLAEWGAEITQWLTAACAADPVGCGVPYTNNMGVCDLQENCLSDMQTYMNNIDSAVTAGNSVTEGWAEYGMGLAFEGGFPDGFDFGNTWPTGPGSWGVMDEMNDIGGACGVNILICL